MAAFIKMNSLLCVCHSSEIFSESQKHNIAFILLHKEPTVGCFDTNAMMACAKSSNESKKFVP